MVHSLKSVSIDDAISGYKVHPFIRGYLRTFTWYFFIISSSSITDYSLQLLLVLLLQDRDILELLFLKNHLILYTLGQSRYIHTLQ